MSINARARNQKDEKRPEHPTDAGEATTIPVIDKNGEERPISASDQSDTGASESLRELAPDDQIRALEEKLAAAQEEAKSAYDRFLRVSAEFDNYKKRILRETADARKYANETLLTDLLPAVDNLERALAASGDENAANALIDGVEMVRAELLKTFEKFGVKPIEACGKPFDPAFHQAMGQEKTDQHPENTVVQEFQRGYAYHDRLLRPSMVIVAKSDNDTD